MRLKLKFLGQVDICLDGMPLTAIKSQKGVALLCYLTVTGVKHSRSALSGLLWADQTEKKARTNLRKTLSRIKPHIGSFLNITNRTIAFNQGAPHWLDVTEFEKGAASKSNIQLLRSVATLYKGDFLSGFDLPETLFGEWTQVQRVRLREMALQVFQTLIKHSIDFKEYDSGISYAKNLLEIEPWHEVAHRSLMCMLALSGQRSSALKQFEECRRILQEELKVEPSSSTKTVFEKIQREEFESALVPDDSDELVSIKPKFSTNISRKPLETLPQMSISLIGRQREIERLEGYLNTPDIHLVTITGLGGIGKTQLALKMAHQLTKSDMFRNGVFFVSLSSVTSRSLLLSAIAEQLNLSLAGSQQTEEILINFLRDKACLVVLDNFEQLLPEIEFIARLLQVVPRSKLLVTSRERLKLREEWVLDLEGLEYPESIQDANIADYAAVTLFSNCARQMRFNFSLDDEIQGVVRICKLTEGMPLALEQAASLMHVCQATDIADQIEKHLKVLSTTLRSFPKRHQSMYAVFNEIWCWLSEEEKNVLCRLSVFRGDFTLEAAKQVACASLSTLATLIDKSLLHMITHRRGNTRYELHDLVRQYAYERLLEMGQEELKRVRNLHLEFFLGISESAEQFWDTEQEDMWLNRLEAERENLHVAYNWAIDQVKTEYSLRLSAALFTFWVYNSPAAEALHLLEASISMPWDKHSSTVMLARAKALNVAGFAAVPVSNFRSAKKYFKDGAKLYKTLGNQRGLAWSLRGCGFVCLIQGKLEEAQVFVEESQNICQEIQDKWGSAWSTYDLGNIALACAELESAETLLESAQLQFHQLGIQFGSYRVLISLGHLRRKKEQWAESIILYRDALKIQDETHYIQFVAQILEGIGHIAIAENRLGSAVKIFGVAQARRDSIEMKRWAYQEIEFQHSLGVTKKLSAKDWQAAWDEGYAMNPKQGITYAQLEIKLYSG